MEAHIEPKFAKSLPTKGLPSFTDRCCILGDVNRLNLFSLSSRMISAVRKLSYDGKYLCIAG